MTPGMEDDGAGLRVLGGDGSFDHPDQDGTFPNRALPQLNDGEVIEDREHVVELDPDAPEPTPLQIAEAEAKEQGMTAGPVVTIEEQDYEPIEIDLDQIINGVTGPLRGLIAGFVKRVETAEAAAKASARRITELEEMCQAEVEANRNLVETLEDERAKHTP